MPEALLAGRHTYWRKMGDDGRPVVALHCALAQSGTFSGLSAALPALCLIAPDFPGHGKSAEWDGRGDYHDEATRVVRALLARMPGPVALIGHSFGATVALRIALDVPEAVSALVLFEPVLFCAARSAGGPAYADHIAAHAGFGAALRAGDNRTAAAAFQAMWGTGQAFEDMPAAHQDYIAARIALIEAQNPALNADAAGMLAYGRLEAVGGPGLLVQGEHSPPIIEAINSELARRLPQVSRATVAGAGHMLPVTHAADCAALVRGFLA